MARGKKTAGQKASLTKKRNRAFKEWNDKREDVTEVFAQCKSVNYWYVSDKGRVVSFYDPDEPKFLKINKTVDGYEYVNRSKKPKACYIHRLQAEADLGVYKYDTAKKYKTIDDTEYEVHHEDGNPANNVVGNTQVLTKALHDVFKSVPKISDSEEKHFEFTKKLAEVASKEQITLVLDGNGIVDGEEVSDLRKGFYGEDVAGVSELGRDALKLKGQFIMTAPRSFNDDDIHAFNELMSREGKNIEKLAIDICKRENIRSFEMTYDGIGIIVALVNNK